MVLEQKLRKGLFISHRSSNLNCLSESSRYITESFTKHSFSELVSLLLIAFIIVHQWEILRMECRGRVMTAPACRVRHYRKGLRGGVHWEPTQGQRKESTMPRDLFLLEKAGVDTCTG